MTNWRIIEGDCVEAMRTMPEASVDAVVCDPPYGLGFMGKEWDSIGDTGRGSRARSERAGEVTPTSEGHSTSAGPYLAAGVDSLRSAGRPFQAWCETWAREALRVLKPGGHLLAAGGTRTYHRLTCAVEDAGFEIRDEVLSAFDATEAGRQFLASLSPEQLKALDVLGGGPLAWYYGSGFPKSLDVSKAIDKAAGAKREVIGPRIRVDGKAPGIVGGGKHGRYGDFGDLPTSVTAPATPDAERWQGWGTALKPAHEPIVLARKPLTGTVAGNVLTHGTGALNVDATRIEGGTGTGNWAGAAENGYGATHTVYNDPKGEQRTEPHAAGRWPANCVLSHSEDCAVLSGQRPIMGEWENAPSGAALTTPTTTRVDRSDRDRNGCVPDCPVRLLDQMTGELTSGSGQRRPRADHSTQGVTFADDAYVRPVADYSRDGDSGGASRFFYCAKADSAERNTGLHDQRNSHPTVKPVALMRWLCRLVTPPRGTILDPFTGSGTTGIAALREGFSFIGIEREAEYVAIARARIIADAPLLNSATELAA